MMLQRPKRFQHNPTIQDADRFWEKVLTLGPEDCWLWQGYVLCTGYGQYSLGKRKVLSHRFAKLLSVGCGNLGTKHVLHLCDNKLCCNPSHLFLGTQRTNMLDKCLKRRQGINKLTQEDVQFIRKSYQLNTYTYKELGDLFGVSLFTVADVVLRRTWKYLK